MQRNGAFISHAHVDQDLAQSLSRLLKDALRLNPDDITCTSDPSHGLPAGSDLQKELQRRLSTARALFLLATPVSRQRDWVHFELAIAEESRKDGLLVYPVTPLDLDADVVPDFYRGRTLVTLSCGEQVHTLVRQMRRDFALPPAEPASYIDSLLDVVDRSRNAERGFVANSHETALEAERLKHTTQLKGFEQTKKAASALGAIGGMLALLAFGLLWWALYLTTTRDAQIEARVSELRGQHANDLAAKDAEKSAAVLAAQLASDREFQDFSLSAQLHDGRSNRIRCSRVEAFVRDRANEPERPVPPKSCDAAGRFTFSAPELQNDARRPVKLRVHVGDHTYETIVRLPDARLAISLPD